MVAREDLVIFLKSIVCQRDAEINLGPTYKKKKCYSDHRKHLANLHNK